MYMLIASIICSVAVSVLLKVARNHRIAVDQAIAFNYVMAGSLCLFLLGPRPADLLAEGAPWPVFLALGLLLPSIFLIMAKAVQHAGIALSDVAQRLSLLIPLIAAFTLFGESVTAGKLIGIAVALCALGCLLWGRGAREDAGSKGDGAGFAVPVTVALLLGVWVGYGVIDILFKQLAKAGSAFPTSLLGAFVLAGIVSFAWLFARRTQWTVRSMLAGLLLGLLNFGNIYFYVRAHQVYSDNPTLVFAGMNIGVISLGTLIGAGVFRERLHWVNFAGVALDIIAIFILFPR